MASRRSITRPFPSAVTYSIPTVPQETSTQITLPPKSDWTSGLHWHERHTEYLHVQQGSVWVHADGVERIYTANSHGETEDARVVIAIPRGVRHEWARADRGEPEGDARDVVVLETTDPADGEKALFFWNLNGVVLASSSNSAGGTLKSWLEGFWLTLQLFVIFRALDNYPVFFRMPGIGSASIERRLQWLVTNTVLWVATLVGRVFDLRAIKEEYTPSKMFEMQALPVPHANDGVKCD